MFRFIQELSRSIPDFAVYFDLYCFVLVAVPVAQFPAFETYNARVAFGYVTNLLHSEDMFIHHLINGGR